jgi:hypothetical protein
MPRLSGPARLWIFGTILWIAFLLWRTDAPNHFSLEDVRCILWDPGPWCMYRDLDRSYYGELAFQGIIVPAVGGFLLFGLAWVIKGFSKPPN